MLLQAYDSTNSFDQLWTFGTCEKDEVIIRHFKDGRVLDIAWWKLQEDQDVHCVINIKGGFENCRGQVWKLVPC